MIVPVIVSGGVGSRLWPASRVSHPKPFLPMQDGKSLLQGTYLRAASVGEITDIVTITARDSSFKTVAEYDKCNIGSVTNHLLLEPMGRDTAAATAVAALYVAETFGRDAILLFLAADHLIRKLDQFRNVVTAAAARAAEGRIVTFGIEPDRPETGYGYIEVDGEQAVRFVEKAERPDRSTISGVRPVFVELGHVLLCRRHHDRRDAGRLPGDSRRQPHKPRKKAIARTLRLAIVRSRWTPIRSRTCPRSPSTTRSWKRSTTCPSCVPI